MEKMHAFNGPIAKLFAGRQSSLMIQENEFSFGSPHYLYIYFRDKGSLRHLAELCQSSTDHVSFSDGCGTGSDSLARAEYACDTGDSRKPLSRAKKPSIRSEQKISGV